MNVTKAEFQNMKEDITKDLISFRMEKANRTMQEAFDDVYHSIIFDRLCDPNTGLYFQSSRYVYSYLEDELSGKIF